MNKPAFVVGIDPGNTTGWAILQLKPPVYRNRGRAPLVELCGETTDPREVERIVQRLPTYDDRVWCYERVRSYGAGLPDSLVDTSEIGGYYRYAHRAVPLTRPEAVRALGLSGRGISKAAVWAEVVRIMGSDRQGKKCPKRHRIGHAGSQWAREVEHPRTGELVPVVDCEVCGRSGWAREPGPLAMFAGLTHARDALCVALALALREGWLCDD